MTTANEAAIRNELVMLRLNIRRVQRLIDLRAPETVGMSTYAMAAICKDDLRGIADALALIAKTNAQNDALPEGWADPAVPELSGADGVGGTSA